MPATNTAEQMAMEIQPCYEVARGKLKEKRKISVIQRRALPTLPHPKTRPSKQWPSPLQRPPRKQLWQVDHKKAAILPHNSCPPSSVPPNFMGDLFSFGLAGSICQPFIRAMHSPCSGTGLCQVKPRWIRKPLCPFWSSWASSRPVACCTERGQHWCSSRDKRNGRWKASAITLAITEGLETTSSADGQWLTASVGLGVAPVPGLCPYSGCASCCTLPLCMWQSKVDWPVARSFVLTDNHQHGHFPNIQQISQRKVLSRSHLFKLYNLWVLKGKKIL